MRNVDPQRARWIRIRMAVLCGVLAIGLGVVLSGAYNIEVRDGEAWRELAEKQRMRRLHVTPKRGTVYDRNGTPLAISVDVPSVSIDAVETLRGIEERYVPMRIRHYAERIAAALHLPVEEVAAKLERRRRFAYLKRQVTREEIDAIRALRDRDQRHPVRGLIIEGEGRRFYPHRDLAGPVLGFVSPDGLGRDGIELSLNPQLRGRREEIRGLRDRAGRLIFAEGIQDEAALAGHNVYLSIDQGIQFIAERELEAALQTYEALGGSVVVVDPATGELLALANAPDFNPNDYNVSEPSERRNRAVLDRFEPGSVMKVFTMAAALSAKSVKPDDSIYCEEGHMPIDNVVIHDTHVSKWLSPTQILQLSSNIGTSKIALGLGQRKLYEAFRRFGFGERPGLPVPSEAAGTLRPRARPWVPVETAAAAFGQGISVTNVQLAMALAAVANKGRLLEPILVSKVTDSTGVVLTEATPRVRRRVISSRVARLIAEMMTSVTEGEGTGVEAAIDGFRVAGKTATAQKIDPDTGRYKDGSYVAAFIGFVPAKQPRLVVSVVIDEPMGGVYSGGEVAAPVFRRVSEMALRYLGVRPRGTRAVKLAEVSEYAKGDDPATTAYAVIKEASGGDEEATAEPAPAAQPPAQGQKGVRVPDLGGMPVRAAVQRALELGFAPRVIGTGRLARVEPEAGTLVAKGAELTLVFEPQT
ncbi:MAG: PASTA domain-containing protein [Deltaproteobacteria bacterium]|nr:PASTA domain-containing protein [Deltaproteobacteria bacterium]MBW2535809.1 PASTA domain-containing protein [Deltaproteobacteria bacterium]